MAGDGLFDPLGTDRAAPARPGPWPSAPVTVTALGLAGIAALLGVAWLRDDGDRGRPLAVSPIARVVAPTPPAPSLPPAPAPVAPVPAPTASSSPIVPPGLPKLADDQTVEVQNGVRIIRPRREPTPGGSQPMRVPGADPVVPR